jgi:hypothetical protein
MSQDPLTFLKALFDTPSLRRDLAQFVDQMMSWLQSKVPALARWFSLMRTTALVAN